MLKDMIVRGVRDVFNDKSRGEQPVRRSADGLFGPGSVVWRVHGDVTTMMVGGVAALLLQMLHPAVLAGVWDHSGFREDMLVRLRRTARFIALTTYGSRSEAEGVIARVRDIHASVRGLLPNGNPYEADDPHLLTWVHVTETSNFLDAWIRYAEPRMSISDQDRYFAEVALVAEKLGASDVPKSRAATMALIDRVRAELQFDQRTKEVADCLINARATHLALSPLKDLTFQAAIDLLPAWARRMHGLRASSLSLPLVQGSTRGLARTLRWAFR